MFSLFKTLFTHSAANRLPISNNNILKDIGLSEDQLPASYEQKLDKYVTERLRFYPRSWY